jgi:hypothetical protein
LGRHGARASTPARRTHARHEDRLPGKQVTAHGTTPSSGVPVFTTASPWPWDAGVRLGQDTLAHPPAEETHGAMVAARRGVFLGLTRNKRNAKAPARRRPAATALGRRGARLQHRRRGSVTVHGGTTTRHLEARRRAHRHGFKGERCEREGRQQRSRWGEGVVVTGLT